MSVRDRVREALARTEPSSAEAKADLQKILVRTKGTSRPAWLVAAAAVAVAALIALGLRRWIAPPPPPTAANGVHIYIHVVGEPEDQALALDVSTHGDK